MVEPILTGSVVIEGWKVISSLYEKYHSWSVRKSASKEAKELKARAEELMKEINVAILSGASSDDPALTPKINEFRALLAKNIKPSGHGKTEEWIQRSRRGAFLVGMAAAKKAAAKKPAAKKAAAKKPAAKKAAAKKPAAKKPAAKKPAAKKPAAKKPAVKKPAVKKPAVKKPAVKKPAVKKTAAKKTAAKKTAAKKTAG